MHFAVIKANTINVLYLNFLVLAEFSQSIFFSIKVNCSFHKYYFTESKYKMIHNLTHANSDQIFDQAVKF